MAQKTDENKLINRYLLGELSDDELAQVEERYFADENFFGRLLEAENSLIDAYALGNLSATEHGRFERQFLITPQRRQKVKFAQSLNRAITEARSDPAISEIVVKEPCAAADIKPSLWQSLAGLFNVQSPALAFGMAGLLLMIFGVGFFAVLQRGSNSTEIAKRETPANEQILSSNRRQPDINANADGGSETPSVNSSPQKTADAQSGNDSVQPKPQHDKQPGDAAVRPEKPVNNANSSSETTEKSTPPAPKPVVTTFMLTPGLLRGEDKRTQVPIPAKASQIRLQLILEANEYFRYQAAIQNPDGEEIWSARAPKVKKGGKTVTLLVPVKLLPKGDYRLILKGETTEGETETISEYPFSVVKK